MRHILPCKNKVSHNLPTDCVYFLAAGWVSPVVLIFWHGPSCPLGCMHGPACAAFLLLQCDRPPAWSCAHVSRCARSIVLVLICHVCARSILLSVPPWSPSRSVLTRCFASFGCGRRLAALPRFPSPTLRKSSWCNNRHLRSCRRPFLRRSLNRQVSTLLPAPLSYALGATWLMACGAARGGHAVEGLAAVARSLQIPVAAAANPYACRYTPMRHGSSGALARTVEAPMEA